MVRAEDIAQLLTDYAANILSEPERSFMQRYVSLLRDEPESFWKRTQYTPGHITASAWVMNKERTQVLLIHHKGANMWFQPGGHVEAEDGTLFDAVLREVAEETGLVGVIPKRELFDIDIHPIAARPERGESAHEHFDMRVCVEVPYETRASVDEGILGVKWCSLDEIQSINNTQSVIRMVAKSRAMH